MSRKHKRRQIRDANRAAERDAKAMRVQPQSVPLEDSVESCLAAMAKALERPAEPESTTGSEDPSKTESIALITDQTEREDWDPSFVPVPSSSDQDNFQKGKDKILNWNEAFHLWSKSGTYTTPLLPPFEVEVARHFKVQSLSSFLLDSCENLKMPAFERWLIDSRQESPTSDPVLSPARYDHSSSQRLLEEIVHSGVQRPTAQTLVRNLCQRTAVALRELADQQRTRPHTALFKKGDRVTLETHDSSVWTLVLHRKKWKKPFITKINPAHYRKLRSLFDRVHGVGPHPPSTASITHVFHLLVMMLLTRYSALSGGQLLMDLRGGGMQGAIHGAVFGVLQKYFPKESVFEGFGSPMNCFLSSFGSAFAEDLDYHFGSMGDFLQLDFRHGVVEANPPFAPGLMDRMAEHIERCLTQAETAATALTFVVIVPDAGDVSNSERAAVKKYGGQSLGKMVTSRFRRHHILLRAKEHGYIEGAQHMRPTRFKESLYDTSVVILQSQVAFSSGVEFEKLEEELRSAFASLHRAEVNKRKQDKETEKGSGRDV